MNSSRELSAIARLSDRAASTSVLGGLPLFTLGIGYYCYLVSLVGRDSEINAFISCHTHRSCRCGRSSSKLHRTDRISMQLDKTGVSIEGRRSSRATADGDSLFCDIRLSSDLHRLSVLGSSPDVSKFSYIEDSQLISSFVLGS